MSTTPGLDGKTRTRPEFNPNVQADKFDSFLRNDVLGQGAMGSRA